tara:strand:+ start:76 stop:270 length:195 start_codon:yes stop_codon:yes gene_type:complete
MKTETVTFSQDAINLMCAVCASDRSGGQIALFIIITSFVSLGLANWAYKKYLKNNPKFNKKFKI